MPSLNKLTLQHIRVLANLRTLALFCFKEPDLSLGACHTDLCDLTSCTQLTSLAITWDTGHWRVQATASFAARWQQRPAATAVCVSSVQVWGEF